MNLYNLLILYRDIKLAGLVERGHNGCNLLGSFLLPRSILVHGFGELVYQLRHFFTPRLQNALSIPKSSDRFRLAFRLDLHLLRLGVEILSILLQSLQAVFEQDPASGKQAGGITTCLADFDASIQVIEDQAVFIKLLLETGKFLARSIGSLCQRASHGSFEVRM